MKTCCCILDYYSHTVYLVFSLKKNNFCTMETGMSTLQMSYKLQIF